MCSDSQDDELYELVRRNYNKVNMPEDDRKAWKIRMDEIFKENA